MKLTRRVSQLEGPLPGGRLPNWARAITAEVAAEAGLDPDEVVREAEAMMKHAMAEGMLMSLDALVAFVARDSGMVPEVILANAEWKVARW